MNKPFNIERYMEQFAAVMMSKYVFNEYENETAPSGLGETQVRSLACVAGHIVYEALHNKRSASVTIEVADNGDIRIS